MRVWSHTSTNARTTSQGYWFVDELDREEDLQETPIILDEGEVLQEREIQ